MVIKNYKYENKFSKINLYLLRDKLTFKLIVLYIACILEIKKPVVCNVLYTHKYIILYYSIKCTHCTCTQFKNV